MIPSSLIPRVPTTAGEDEEVPTVDPEQNGRTFVGPTADRFTPRLLAKGPACGTVPEEVTGALVFTIGVIEPCRGNPYDEDMGALPNPTSIAPTIGVFCAKNVGNNWPIGISASSPTSRLSEPSFLARVSFGPPDLVVSSTFYSNALRG